AVRRLYNPGSMAPAPGDWVEYIVCEQAPAVPGDHAHRLDDVVGDDIGDEVVEVDPHPARLDPLASSGDLPLELMRPFQADPQQAGQGGAGARPSPTRLDSNEVVEPGHDEVVRGVAP